MNETQAGRERWLGWIALWERTAELVRGLGGEVEGPDIEPPATEADIAEVEAAIGRTLPSVFKKVLLEFSREVEFEWELPYELDDQFGGATDGYASWSLDSIVEVEESRQEHAKEFDDVAEYEGPRRWQSALAWCGGIEFEFLAFDVRVAGEPPVVLLDPEGGLTDAEAWLARDFEDFFDRWSRVGCAGGILFIDSFLPEPGKGLDPDCSEAVAFRNALGLVL